jgi:protein-L-isoaspartate(D-aspartate) O-methyltransferase
VIGRIARRVIAIERHHELAALAQQRMDRLGYANVTIVEGDGTEGYPQEAPFDAIVAAASGPHVPQVWLDQLRPGGRIVMPIGDPGSVQTLMKIVKTADGGIETEDLGAVRFVPLIGAHGFADEGSRAHVRTIPEIMAEAAEHLPDIDDPAFAHAFDRFADARAR